MIVFAWNNGKHSNTGRGYGLRLSKTDRDKYFKGITDFVHLYLGNSKNPIKVEIKKCFWNQCSELRDIEIGLWFHKIGCSKWPNGEPPKFSMKPTSHRCFVVRRLTKSLSAK